MKWNSAKDKIIETIGHKVEQNEIVAQNLKEMREVLEVKRQHLLSE